MVHFHIRSTAEHVHSFFVISVYFISLGERNKTQEMKGTKGRQATGNVLHIQMGIQTQYS